MLMQQLFKAKDFLISKGIDKPAIGIVLGTGMHQLLDLIHVKQAIPYSTIPGFPVSTVEFHKGNLIYGVVGDKHILVMQGDFIFMKVILCRK